MKLKLKETNQIIEIDENKYKELDLNCLDTTDFRNKEELIRYLNNALKEKESKDLIDSKIRNIDVFNVTHTTKRFEKHDAIALSGFTYSEDEKYWYQFHGQQVPEDRIEQIYIEYKYRTGTTANQYQSVIIDNIKYNELKQIHNSTGCKVIVCYLFKDSYIRVIDLFKNKIDCIKYNQKIKDNVYNDRMKVVDLYCFNNSKTIIL